MRRTLSMNRTAFFLFGGGGVLLFGACVVRDMETDTDTDLVIEGVEDPTHDIDIQPIWDAKCEDCHTPYNEGGLSLENGYTRADPG